MAAIRLYYELCDDGFLVLESNQARASLPGVTPTIFLNARTK